MSVGRLLYQSLSDAGEQFAKNCAIVDEHGSLTYEALFGEVDALAARLPELSGLPIGIMAPNGRTFAIALLAILNAGGVAVPLPPDQIPDVYLGELKLAGMLFDGSLTVACGEQLGPFRYRELDAAGSSASQLAALVNQPAVIRPTSGTTGQAKGVVLSQRSVLERIDTVSRALRLQSSDRVCWVMPMSQHFVASVLTYLHCGCSIVCASGQYAETIAEAVRREQCTFLYAAPIHFALLTAPAIRGSLRSLRLAVSTTAPLHPDIARRFENLHGFAPRQVLGIIELGLPLGDLFAERTDSSSVGSVLPGFEFRLEGAELLLRGPGMFDAYLSPPQKREAVLADGWFRTGDLARVDANGQLEIIGRKKTVIITAGQKVFPEEVELVLDRCPGIERSRVRAEPHGLLGEIVVADVELRPGASLDEELAISFCKKHLSRFKVPQRILVQDKIPLTPTGKISRI